MATTLKKTNVVIIGLGAAGGVACLPLAQAGLEVIGLEAGSWLNTKDMAPDELKLARGLCSASAASHTLSAQASSCGKITRTLKPSSTCKSMPNAPGCLLGARWFGERQKFDSCTFWLMTPAILIR